MLNVGIKMPQDLRDKAREYEINISKISRKAVEDAVQKCEKGVTGC